MEFIFKYLFYYLGLDSVLAPFLVLNFEHEGRAFCCLQFFIQKHLKFYFLPGNFSFFVLYIIKEDIKLIILINILNSVRR